MSSKVAILTYHSIDNSGSIISTGVDKFRSQMQHLRDKKFKVISLNEIVTHIRESRPFLSKTLAITFDDGYKNFYHVAYPVLKSFGFKATVFLVSRYLGETNRWNGQPKEIPVLDLLDWDAVKELAANGMVFGAHTMHHPDLSELTKQQAYTEIIASKSAVQKHLGKDASFFAYPYGSQTAIIKEIIEKQFLGACSTELDFVTLESNIYSMPRIDMYYLSNNNFFSGIGTSAFFFYITFRKVLRSMRIKANLGIKPNGFKKAYK
jgi:peptidoglycan/xylan/chitin deacetylase (PgdA/CDA1 family)